MNRSLATVIVVNWNGREHLETCLSSLCRQTYQEREIVLVDNGSVDGSADYTESQFPEVRVLRLPKNLGYGGGNNAAIAQAQGEFIALVNNDTEVESTWLAESVNALQSHPEAGVTASRMRLFDRRTHLDNVGDDFFRAGYGGKRGWLMPDGPEFDRNTWVFSACSGAAVYRHSMLKEVGLFDEDFFVGYEDVDLGFRSQLFGYHCLYVASAIVYHKVSATLRALSNSNHLEFRFHRNRWYVLVKNLPLALWLRYSGQILMSEAIVLAAAARRGRLGVLLQARVDIARQMPNLLKKRRTIQGLRRVSGTNLDSIIRKDWFSVRLAQKRRETEINYRAL